MNNRFPLSRINHLLIDLDGVLFRGNTALPGASNFISWLRRRQTSFRLVTNNSTLTPGSYAKKLAKMGMEVEAASVFTSALATGLYLGREARAGQTAYVIGEEGLREAVQSHVLLADGLADWVIVGLDRHLTYEKLAKAALALENGARFIGSNVDASVPTERGLEPGAGAITAALQATTGSEPLVLGKPQPLMLELAMRDMGGTVDSTALIGDRLDTDIAAANALGIPSVLVLTGVSRREDLETSSYQPTLLVETLAELMDSWRQA